MKKKNIKKERGKERRRKKIQGIDMIQHWRLTSIHTYIYIYIVENFIDGYIFILTAFTLGMTYVICRENLV